MLQAVAAAELVADKLPFTPSRTKAISLIARAASGGIVGAALSPRLRAAGAAVGAAAALVATFGLHRLRSGLTTRLRVPNLLAGAIEDALVIGLGSKLASRVARSAKSAGAERYCERSTTNRASGIVPNA